MELSGKVIVKVQLADDIRRIPIHNDAITYDELLLMMQRLFGGKLSSSDDITIKYKDEDGDLITINDSSDLSFAIQCNRVLKLSILMNCPENTSLASKSVLSQVELIGLKTQLRTIRDQVNMLLDSLDGIKDSSTSTMEQSNEKNKDDATPSKETSASKVKSSKFDSLQHKTAAAMKSAKEGLQTDSEVSGSRPHSVPVVHHPAMPATIADHYGRTSASGYPQISSYANVPAFSQPYVTSGGFIFASDHPHVPPNPNVYANTSQPNPPYSAQLQQQPFHAPSPAGYSAHAQGNPYSKNYPQPSPQHAYMQHR